MATQRFEEEAYEFPDEKEAKAAAKGKFDIQAQDKSGVWRTYHTTINNSQKILSEMESLKRNLPDYRVRAIDKNGRIVDILG
mgnify:CR=1 FL=1